VVAAAAVLSGPAWAAQASQADAIQAHGTEARLAVFVQTNGPADRSCRMKFIRFGLCGPPKARNLSAAASLVPVREELFPVWGCPSGLGASARVTVVSAPPGSGETVLLRPWIGKARLAEHAAWVTVERDERDPQRLWLAVLMPSRWVRLGVGRAQAAAASSAGATFQERITRVRSELRHALDADDALCPSW
jgi:hypothetical protein